MKRLHHTIVRTALVSGLVLGTAFVFMVLTTQTSSHYVSSNNTLSERVIHIPYEQALVDYCAALNKVKGVTGVSYREYDVLAQTAIVTVHYDAQETTPQQIRTYLGNTRSIWDDALQA